MKAILRSALLMALVVDTSAMAGPKCGIHGEGLFTSGPEYFGQGVTQQGHKGATTFVATISSTVPVDANGNYVTWKQTGVLRAQESFADTEALNTRKACNATCDQSCIMPGQGWEAFVGPQTTYEMDANGFMVPGAGPKTIWFQDAEGSFTRIR